MKKAIFLDRDGTLNPNIPYLSDYKLFEFFDGVVKGIQKLFEADYKIILITNQSGISRGLITLDELELIHKKIKDSLAIENCKLDGIYFCPHLPEDGCSCRKPRTGLIELATKDHEIDLSISYFIGDRYMDMIAGKDSGMRTIFIPEQPFRDKSLLELKEHNITPDFICNNFNEAVNLII